MDNIFQVNAGDYLVCGQDVPNGIILFPTWVIEYINESSNVINQITNAGTVQISSQVISADYIRVYNAPGTYLAMNNANTTKNGLTGVLAYLITSQAGYIQDFSNGTFFTRIDDHVGFFSKAGRYRFDCDFNM